MIVNDWQARHGLSAEAYQLAYDELRGKGYRLVKVTAAAPGGTPRFAGLWQMRGGGDWQARHGLSEADYQAAVTALGAEGFRVTHVSAFRQGSATRFNAIFEVDNGPDAVVHHGLTDAAYQALFTKLEGDGWRLRCVSGYEEAGDARYACVWERYGGPPWIGRHGLDAATWQKTFDRLAADGYRLLQSSGYTVQGSERFAGVWEQSPGRAWRSREGLPEAHYANEFDAARNDGYRLVDLSVAERGDGLAYTTIWEDASQDQPNDDVKALVFPFMQKWGVPGFACSLARHGGIIAEYAFGYENYVTREIVTPATRFRIASVSKPITSVAIFRLIEMGRLTLSTRVFGADAILGTRFGTAPYGRWITNITVQHLLQHTAGGWATDAADPMGQQPQLSADELISWTLDTQPLATSPGTAFAYSNFGYCVLGRVIEAASKQTYEQFVRDNVLAACGITDMVLGRDTAADRQWPEACYVGRAPSNPYRQLLRRMDASGGWIATATDVLRFGMRVDGFAAPADILQGDTIAAMTTPSRVEPTYACGWTINENGVWQHNGLLSGTTSTIRRTAVQHTCVAVMSAGNSGSGLMGEFAALVARIDEISAPPEPAPMSKVRRTVASSLALVAVALFVVALWTAASMLATSRRLSMPQVAPVGALSLELAPSRAQAAAILTAWRAPDPDAPGATLLDTARGVVDRQRSLMAMYAISGAFLGLALLIAFRYRGDELFALSCFWLAAVSLVVTTNLAENEAIRALLVRDPTKAIDSGVVESARIAAQLKFSFLLIEFWILFFATLLFLRSWWDPESMPAAPPPLAANPKAAFRAVTETETCAIEIGESDSPVIDLGPAEEPWVAFRSSDLFGLALSGGGIRSATFGLGVLQGLEYLDILKHAHFLATVSGGGYIGGFWTAWRHRPPGRRGFPKRLTGDGHGGQVTEPGDSEEVRHLREFSRFLSPRVGFFETEMWTAIIAFLGGLLPSATATLALLYLALFGWLGLNLPLACPDPSASALMIAAITAVICLAYERAWYTYAAPEGRDLGRRHNHRMTAGAVAVVAVLQYLLPSAISAIGGTRWPILDPQGHWVNAGQGFGAVDHGAYTAWWHMLMGVRDANAVRHTVFVSPRLFDYAVVWLATTALFLVARLGAVMLVVRAREEKGVTIAALDRVVMRLVALSLLWAGAAALWHLGVNLSPDNIWLAASGAAATGGTFALLRKWIGKAFRLAPKKTITALAKPFVPQILAYATIGLVAIVLVSLSVWIMGHDWLFWYEAALVAGCLAILMVHLDPAEYSLHAFYRDRICRAYLGASNPAAGGLASHNRPADYRAGDDIALEDLRPERPLHLVCCAANDLSGDQVATLSRGAKSATFSPYGVTIGGYMAAIPRLTLGSALTASAAAFNSTMGSVSKRLGPAVSFLMAAMNLRLGLWVPHPATRTPRRRQLPGLLFYKELFGLTDATPVADSDTRADVHLSDGGHFENLALYELVRRHCRYIVVADCGEDPEVAFDDFGNAVRRVREDFGVEIEIDLEPLTRGADGRARQHLAVGIIHYDRRYDKGTIVLMKPTLTGDEPPDVLQYQRRNTAFPHEPTSDQFFDEAQWESYRRLGVHSALSAFRFVERLTPRRASDPVAADQIFMGVRQEWWPTPADFAAKILSATDRFRGLESGLLQRDTPHLLAEIFPEVAQRLSGPPSLAEQIRTVTALVDTLQVFEDVWLGCHLDTQWNHPLNLGWNNAFARWTTAATFKAWWPVLSPMFSPGFQRFLRERFPVLDRRAEGRIRLVPTDLGVPGGLAATWWTSRLGERVEPGARRVYEYLLPLGRPTSARPMQVALLLLTIDPADPSRAMWTSEDFFVPPSLWGAGLGGQFLRALLEQLPPEVKTCDVYIVNRHYEVARAQRTERLGFLEFYRGFGFQMIRKGNRAQAAAEAPELLQLLAHSGAGADAGLDAWVQLRWGPALGGAPTAPAGTPLDARVGAPDPLPDAQSEPAPEVSAEPPPSE